MCHKTPLAGEKMAAVISTTPGLKIQRHSELPNTSVSSVVFSGRVAPLRYIFNVDFY